MKALAVEEKAKSEGEGGAGMPMVGMGLVGQKSEEKPGGRGTKKKPESTDEPKSEPRETAASIDDWRKKVAGRIDSIPTPRAPDRGHMAAGMQGAAEGAQARSMATRENAPGSVRSVLPATPEAAAPPPPRVVDPVPQATQLVVAKSDRKLSDQALPVVQKPPPRPGGLPWTYPRPVLAAEYGTGMTGAADREEETATGTTPDQQKADAINALAAAGPDTADRAGHGETIVLTDEGAPPSPPISPAAKSDVAAVLAIVLADADKAASGMVTQAQQDAYPSPENVLVSAFPRFVVELAPEIESVLREQMEQIRAQVEISREELDAKIAVRLAQLENRRTAAQEGNIADAAGNADAIRLAGQDALDAVGGACRSAEEYIEEQQEAASSSVDPEVVRAKSQRLKRDLLSAALRQGVQYEQAGERRTRALAAAGAQIVKNYEDVAKFESAAIIRAETSANKSEEDAYQAAVPLLRWARARIDETAPAIVKLQSAAIVEARKFAGEVRLAGFQCGLLIEEWADQEIAEHAGFWDRFLDWIRSWSTDAIASVDAWAEANTAATKDAIVNDLSMMAELEAMGAGDIDAQTLLEAEGLTANQRAIRYTYFGGTEAGNPLVAVAMGVRLRIYEQQKANLFDKFTKGILEAPKEEWEAVASIGAAENPNFHVLAIASELNLAMEDGWFDRTDEPRIYRALDSLTPIQVAAVRKCYAFHDMGSGDLQEDLEGELSGLEETHALELLGSNQLEADVAGLLYALIDRDEAAVFKLLRGRNAEQRKALRDRYEVKAGAPLEAHLEFFLGGHDRERAQALARGHTATADAIALDDAMHGGLTGIGTDIKAIKAVYAQVRAEVEAEGKRERWTTDRVEAEIKERNHKIGRAYQGRYSTKKSDKRALFDAFESEMEGAELDLVMSTHLNDVVGVDAARLRVEKESLFTDKDVLLDVFRAQQHRAVGDVKRDLTIDFQDRASLATLAGVWDEAEELKKLNEAIESGVATKARKNMRAVKDRYDQDYDEYSGVRDLVDSAMSGIAQEEALVRLKGGRLTLLQEVFAAVKAEDEKRLKELLTGKSEAEIKELESKWNSKLHRGKGQDFRSRVLSVCGDRDLADMKVILEGTPETPEDVMKQAGMRLDFELRAWLGSWLSAERARLKSLFENLETKKKKLDALQGAPGYAAAYREFMLAYQYFDRAIEDHRGRIDTRTGTVLTAIAVVVAVVFVLGTAGFGAAALVPAFAPAAGFLGSAAGMATMGGVTVGTIVAMKGQTVGAKELRNEALVAAGELVLHVPIGKVSKIALKGLAKPVAGLAKHGAGGRAIGAALYGGLEEGIEGVAPSAIAAALDEDNWNSQNTFGDIFRQTKSGALENVVTGGLTKGTHDFLHSYRHFRQSGKTSWSPEELQAELGKPKTGKTPADLQAQPEPVATHVDPAQQHELERTYRKYLLSGVPLAEQPQFAKVPIDVVSDVDFDVMTLSASGEAVVLIKDGLPHVVVRASAHPMKLLQESPHLMQSIEKAIRAEVLKLDEKVMAQWNTLDLTAKFDLVETKLKLELDAQHRAIKIIEGELAAKPDDATRDQLHEQLDDVALNLNNLAHLLEGVHSITPDQIQAMKDGDLATPKYVDQPPRLFSKKPRRPPQNASGPKQGTDPPEKGLVAVGNSPLQKKAGTTKAVYQRGPEFPDHGDTYRRVELWTIGPPAKFVEGYSENLNVNGHWVKRGKDRTLTGLIGEEASEKMSDDLVREASMERKEILSIHGRGGPGFDDVLIYFEPDGVRIVMIEVKNKDGYVAFAEFTALQDVDNSLGLLKDRLLELRAQRRLSRDQWAQVDAALTERHFDLEIRLGPKAHLGEYDRGTVLKKIQGVWKAKKVTAGDITIEKLTPALIHHGELEIAKKNAIRKVQDGSGALLRKRIGIELPIVESPGSLFQDAKGDLFSVIVASPGEAAGALSYDLLAVMVSEVLVNDAKRLKGRGTTSVRVILDRSLLSNADRALLEKSLRKRAKDLGIPFQLFEKGISRLP